MARELVAWQREVLDEWAAAIDTRESDGYRLLEACLTSGHKRARDVADDLAIDYQELLDRTRRARMPSPYTYLRWCLMLHMAQLWEARPHALAYQVALDLGFHADAALSRSCMRTLGVSTREARELWPSRRIRQHILNELILSHREELARSPLLAARPLRSGRRPVLRQASRTEAHARG